MTVANYYLISFSLSLVICFITSFVFLKFNVVDKPDGIRKIHEGEISYGGGLAIFLSILITCLVLLDHKDLLFEGIFEIGFISFAILILGFIDDIKPLPIAIRLISQILISWLVILLTDIYVKDLGDLFGFGNIYLGELGIPITIFMVVGMCNAFNMLDGIDGLVVAVAFSVFTAVSIISIIKGISLVIAFIPSIALFSFLLFNLGLLGKKWKMFLGDSGAMWLGFITAWYLIVLSQGEEMLFSPPVALWMVMLPLIDALSTFLTRMRQRKPVFSGDRTHIHHIMLDSGIEKWIVIVTLLSSSVLFASLGVLCTLYLVEDSILFYGFLTIWIFYLLLIKYPLSKEDS